MPDPSIAEPTFPPLATVLFALGCGLLTAILLRRSYKYFGSRPKKSKGPIEKQPRPTGPWSGAYSDAQARFDRQQVELHELARELKGQLDSKIMILQELVARSERQIERLETLLDEAEKK